MLILVGMSTESTACATRHMLIFHSATLPGTHYKIETDAGTVNRLREILGAEMNALQSIAEIEDEEDDSRGKFGRL